MENKKRDDTATLTAEAHNVSARYVRMLINGERKSSTDKAKAIVATYNNIVNAKHNIVEQAETTA